MVTVHVILKVLLIVLFSVWRRYILHKNASSQFEIQRPLIGLNNLLKKSYTCNNISIIMLSMRHRTNQSYSTTENYVKLIISLPFSNARTTYLYKFIKLSVSPPYSYACLRIKTQTHKRTLFDKNKTKQKKTTPDK